MFHMTGDSQHFVSADDLRAEGAVQVGNCWERNGSHWLPLYESKMIQQFNHRFGTYEGLDLATGKTKCEPYPRQVPLTSNRLTSSCSRGIGLLRIGVTNKHPISRKHNGY